VSRRPATAKPIPEDFRTVVPVLTVHETAPLIDFLKASLGASLLSAEHSARGVSYPYDFLMSQKKKGAMAVMRFMIIVKATKDSEAGVMPSEKLLTEMGRFNEELANAGVMLAGEGLQPSSKGKRVKFWGNTRTVTDGPFPETKELIAGFWLWQCQSMEEAVEWVKRCPNPAVDGKDGEIEIRQIFEAEDFGAEFTPELREQEERIRAQIAGKK
jgi:hypothetical protein